MSEEVVPEIPNAEAMEDMEDIIDILNEESEIALREDIDSEPNEDDEDSEDDNDDMDEDEDDDEEDGDGDEAKVNREAYTGKIFDLITSLQSRDVPLEDEWDNDDDTGYITISLTEDEFFEFENV